MFQLWLQQMVLNPINHLQLTVLQTLSSVFGVEQAAATASVHLPEMHEQLHVDVKQLLKAHSDAANIPQDAVMMIQMLSSFITVSIVLMPFLVGLYCLLGTGTSSRKAERHVDKHHTDNDSKQSSREEMDDDDPLVKALLDRATNNTSQLQHKVPAVPVSAAMTESTKPSCCSRMLSGLHRILCCCCSISSKQTTPIDASAPASASASASLPNKKVGHNVPPSTATPTQSETSSSRPCSLLVRHQGSDVFSKVNLRTKSYSELCRVTIQKLRLQSELLKIISERKHEHDSSHGVVDMTCESLDPTTLPISFVTLDVTDSTALSIGITDDDDVIQLTAGATLEVRIQ
jgi:hypothetical protein